MKRTIEILLRLVAPPVRLAALLLAICGATNAWATAPTPTVVWESDFGTSKTVDGSTFEIVPNSASIDANGNLAIGSTTGSSYTSPTLAIPAAFQSDKITVLIKYSGLAAYSAANAALSSVKAEYDGDSIVYGLRSNGAGSLNLIGYNETSASVSSLGSTVSLGTGAGYYLVSTDTGVGVYGYTGTHVKGLSGSSTALKKTSNWKVTSVSLGGSHGVNKAYAWAGVTIEKVAIFIGNAYSNTDLADFVWPSSEYAKWAYANNAYTWVPSKDSSDIGSSSNGTLYQFDVASGEDTSTTFASGGNNWKQFCIGQTQYSAPGCALRFTSSSADKTFTGGFDPFTFGGIIVESDAGGLSIGTTSDTARTTVFGAATGDTETWFRFDADASVKRGGAFRFSGNVNLDIANGKTLSLAAAGSPAIVASVTNNQMATTAGGTLRVHGEGKLDATLNASGAALDFSDQPTASASTTSAYIQGALTVDEDTTFTFPTGATFPYFVATSISGDIDHNTGYKANADGSISVVVPTVLNITSAEPVELPTTWTSSDDAVVNVSAGIDATLNVTAAATLSTITFYVPATSTLTISDSAITASTIYFPQPGVVKVSSAGALVGTAKGSGTLQYSGVLPTITSGISFSNSDWTGTMWLKDFGSLSNGIVNSNLTGAMPSWGNSGSKVKFTNVKAYAPNSDITCNYTLVLEDGAGSGEYAWRCDNGYSSNSVVFGGLAGSGTFYDGGTVTSPFKFNSYNNFTGVFNISTAGHRIGLSANCNGTGGTIAIGPGVTVNFEEGKVWTAGGGFVVNADATLNVNADATVKFTDQGMRGTLNISAGVTLTSTGSDALGYNATGTVNVYGTLAMGATRWTCGSSNYINLYEGASITGTGDTSYSATIDMNIANGTTVYAYGNATVACPIRSSAGANGKIVVDSGKTLTVSGRIFGDYQTKKQGEGTLLYTYSGSDFVLPTVEAGTVLLGGSRTWNLGTLRGFSGLTLESGSAIAIDQTQVEYATGTTTVDKIDSSIASITVNKADGTTATLTRTDSTSTLVESVVVSGAACWYDFTFTNTITTASGSSAGTVTLNNDAGPAYGTLTDAANNTYSGLYAYCRPYKDINLGSTTQFTVALYGTMPTADNTILFDCGGCGSAGALLLASGSSANEAKLYYYNSSGLTSLATMAATSCRTTPHLYVFEKISDHQVNIYLDGKLALAYVNNDITFTLTAGFQVASGYAGVPSGLNAIAKTATTDTTLIAMTRIYDRIITDAEMAVLKTEWPYFSPNGDSARTLDSGETAADWTETGKWTVNNTSADTPLANSVVTLTNSAEADATVSVNLDGNTEYESVKFAGDNAISVALKSGYTGKIIPDAAIFETDTTVAVDATSLTSCPVEVASGKKLTFDVTSLIDNSANAIASVQLTGVTTLGDGAKIEVTATGNSYWSLSATADAGGNYWVNFAPTRELGTIYWKSTNYANWDGSNGENFQFTTDAAGEVLTRYYKGDTVVVLNSMQFWIPNGLGACNFQIGDGDQNNPTVKFAQSGSNADYTMQYLTVTVMSGATVSIDNLSAENGTWANNYTPVLYNTTISGAGKVEIPANMTSVTLSGTSAITAPITGAGKLVFGTAPSASTALSFDNWTGTVALPSFVANGHTFDNYGNSGSVVELAGVTRGWLAVPAGVNYATYNTELKLAGNFALSGMSQRAYTFAKFSGTGDIRFYSPDNQPTSIAITSIGEGYSGTVNNATTATLTIGNLYLASGTSVAAGTKILSTSKAIDSETDATGSFVVSKVYVNGVETALDLEYKDDGVYVSELQDTGVWDGTTAVVTNTTAAVTVPASATAVALAFSTDSEITLTSTTLALSTQNITVYATDANGQKTSTDISSAFKVTAGENNTYTVSLDGSATVNDVKVQPTIGESATVTVGDEEVPATALSGSGAPSFAIKTIPGLWYAVEESTDASTFTAGAPVQATSAGTLLSAGAPSSVVKYYKIAVGASKAALQ